MRVGIFMFGGVEMADAGLAGTPPLERRYGPAAIDHAYRGLLAVGPVTGFGLQAASVATVGGALMVTEVEAVIGPPLPGVLTLSVYGPPGALPAVTTPVDRTVPPPLSAQVRVGCGDRATLN